MQRFWILICLPLAMACPATAATLYRWTDASGTARYGYQPPSGVEAVPAEEERKSLYAPSAPPTACDDLAQRHLALIDREIERVKALKTGLGPEYDITPAASQELILDLLAHRAALLTGRTAAEFRAPTFDEAARAQNRLQGENARMRDEIKARDAALDAQANRLKRAQRDADVVNRLLHPFGSPRMAPPVVGPDGHP